MSPVADPLSIPIRAWLDVRRGLNSVDAATEGTAIIAMDYAITTRLTLLRNAELLERDLAAYDKLDRELAAKWGVATGMELNEVTAQKIAGYLKDQGEAKDSELEIGITKIKLASLLTRPDGKGNRLPQSVLHRLAPIIED